MKGNISDSKTKHRDKTCLGAKNCAVQFMTVRSVTGLTEKSNAYSRQREAQKLVGMDGMRGAAVEGMKDEGRSGERQSRMKDEG
jgi:hypothetical protein